MDVDNFKRRVTDDGIPCIEFWEDPTKCRGKGLNPNTRVTPPKMVATFCERCPVALFDLYMSKRPAILKNCGRFYLTPKQNVTLEDDVCYMVSSVGKNKVSTFMKSIVKDTELEHCGLKFTNHSGRKTVIKKLKNANVPESSIIKLTGHTTEKGLKNYDPGDDGEFTTMSHVITGASSSNTQGQRGVVQKSTVNDAYTSTPTTSDLHTIVQHNSSSVALSLNSSECNFKNANRGGNISYHNCKVYNIETMNQNVSNKKKRKYVIDDSSDSQE